MRRIDFRGQRLDTKEWTYGCLLITELKGNLEPLHYFICPIKNEGMHRVMPETVGQFTGLHDKNGIEIYESDILRDSRRRKFVITWNNDIGNWVNKPTDNGTSYPCFNIGTVKGLEVVGNIYDNPELLESEVN